jgi:putative sterol carrier protein
VPRFYSPEWVAAFNEAVSDLPANTEKLGEASLAAGSGTFAVTQRVSGAPEEIAPGGGGLAPGRLAVTLEVEEGRLRLVLDDERDPGENDEDAGQAMPKVTVALSYEDAAALSRGELDPAGALATGRIRVRGDLSVLVAAEGLLAAAAARMGALQASTTY